LNTEIELETSKVLKYNDVDDLTFDFNALDFSNPFKNNYGLAIDIGLEYSLSDKSQVFLNAYDIGSISWSNLSRRYTSNVSSDYQGLDIAEYFETEDEIILIDSLRSLLQVEETFADYSSGLSGAVSAGVTHSFSKEWTGMGALTVFDLANTQRIYTTVGVRRKFSERIQIGISYSHFAGSHSAGINAIYSTNRIQFRFATDCLRSLISPYDTNISTFSMGVSYGL
jgi:long-subunit fatty acid transport protein